MEDGEHNTEFHVGRICLRGDSLQFAWAKAYFRLSAKHSSINGEQGSILRKLFHGIFLYSTTYHPLNRLRRELESQKEMLCPQPGEISRNVNSSLTSSIPGLVCV